MINFKAKLLRFPMWTLNKTLFVLLNRLQFFVYNIHYSKFPTINGILGIKNAGKILFGKNVSINSHIYYNPIGGDTKSYFHTGPNGYIEIGNNVGISNSTIVSFCSIIIEDNVLIGGGCKIYDTDFHSLNSEFRDLGKERVTEIKIKSIVISKNVFIGAHSIILKGVYIGAGAVIGSGSVVTKHVPPGEVWAGNPARFIKKL